MTLVQAAIYKNFVLMTSDTKEVLVKQEKNEKGYYRDAKVKPELLSNETEKVEFVTDYVMMGTGGLSLMCEWFRDFVKRNVNKKDGLYACKLALEKAVEKIYKDISSDEGKELMDSRETIGVMLIGFYEDGKTGLVRYQSGGTIEHVIVEGNNFLTTAIMPTDDLDDRLLHDVIIGNQSNDVNGFVNCMAWTHACISKVHHELVSSDMRYYALVRTKDGIGANQGEFDTVSLYQEIPDEIV